MSNDAQRPLTESEQALLAYFYTVATHPSVKAAGYDPIRLKSALLERVAADGASVIRIVLGRAVDRVKAPARMVTRGVAATALGGTVSPKAAEEIASGLETAVADGIQKLGDWLSGKIAKPSTSPRSTGGGR